MVKMEERMSKSCFTCKHHNFDGSWLDNETCVDCMGRYSEKKGRKHWKYDHDVALRTHGIDKMLAELDGFRIKCAAIRYKDEIYEGRNHPEIGIQMVKSGVCPKPYPGGKDQGFVTFAGEYVERDVAMELALESGQVTKGYTHHPTELFSEDLNYPLDKSDQT
jgi:hypothetical protein